MFGEPQMNNNVNLLGHSLRNEPPSNPKQPKSVLHNQSFQPAQRELFSAIQNSDPGVSSKLKKQQQKSNEELNENEGIELFQIGGMTLSESKLKLPEGILDTGLEPLFEKFFAIRDEPLEISNAPENRDGSNPKNPQRSHNKAWLMTTTGSFVIVIAGIAMHFYR